MAMPSLLRSKNSFFFNKEFPELLDGDQVRESRRKLLIAVRNVEVINTIHYRKQTLINKPLLGDADFNYFALFQIKLCFGETNQYSLVCAFTICCVEETLMRPCLDYALPR